MFQKSELFYKIETRSINPPSININEDLRFSKCLYLLKEVYEKLNEKVFDNELITKGTMAEHFFLKFLKRILKYKI